MCPQQITYRAGLSCNLFDCALSSKGDSHFSVRSPPQFRFVVARCTTACTSNQTYRDPSAGPRCASSQHKNTALQPAPTCVPHFILSCLLRHNLLCGCCTPKERFLLQVHLHQVLLQARAKDALSGWFQDWTVAMDHSHVVIQIKMVPRLDSGHESFSCGNTEKRGRRRTMKTRVHVRNRGGVRFMSHEPCEN